MAFFDYMAARAADSHAARTGNAGYSTMKEKAVSGDVRGAQKMAANLALATGAGIALAGLGTLGVGGAALYTAPNTIAGLEAANALGAEAIGAGAVSTVGGLGSVGLGIQLDNSIQNKGTEPTKTRTTATTATATQPTSNVVSPDPTKGETWVSMYERSNPTLTYDQRTKSLVNGNQRAFVMEQAALGNDALPDGRINSNTGGGTQYIDRSLYTLGPDNVWRKKTEVAEQKTPYQGLFSGDLRSYQNRKNWVAEHKDYLKEKGVNIDWDNYRGTPEQNIALKKLLGGYDAWNSARAAAAQPEMSGAERFVKEGYASGRPWLDAELLNMDGDAALYLNKEDYGRWMGLLTGNRWARPYVTPSEPAIAKPVPTKTPSGESITVAPYATVNPGWAATPTTEVASGPITPEMKFKMNPLGSTYRPAIKRVGGSINYQKIFK